MSISPRFSRIVGALGALLIACTSTLAATGTYNVRENGAAGDGRTVDTEAINRTIAAAAAGGGGTVFFPAGTYLSFSIHLKSNVGLYLDQGATILAAEPSANLTGGYDAPEDNPGANRFEDFGHSHWHNSLIWGENLENISILGPGRIYGRGLSRRSNRRDLLPEERALAVEARPDLSLPAEARAIIAAQKPDTFGYPDQDTLPTGVGNKAIALKNCRNVIFRDFTVYHGGHFAILATGVDNWTCDNLKIDTNRDGIDVDCCRNVRVSNCSVNSPNDDAICPKSSFALGYLRPTENVTITNCQVSGFDEGTFLDGTRRREAAHNVGGGPTGRIKCGTESNGGFRNITISNCVFEYCRGLALESVDGALMEDITVSNLTMRDIGNAPIFIRLGARLRGPEGTKIGTARRIKISSVVASNVSAAHGILLVGTPGSPLEDIELSDILIQYAGGGTKEQAAREVPELEKEYPDPSRYGILPTYGMYVRHVKNLSLDHVELRYVTEDLRPCIFFQDVVGADVDHLKAAHAADTPILVLSSVTDLNLHQSTGLPDTQRASAEATRAADPDAEWAPPWTPSDPPNSPMGKGRGIFPGRVTWARDLRATPWDAKKGHWWEDVTGINQNTVDAMLSHSLQALTGASSETVAWQKLFLNFNRSSGRADRAYVAGEKVAFKINCNNAYEGYGDDDNQIDASPQAVLAVVRQLVKVAGVRPEDVSIYEATRVIPDRVWKKTHAEFPAVHFVDSMGNRTNGREPVEWQADVVGYSVPNPMVGRSVPKCVKEAAYLINMALLKGHPTTGVTLTAKNHYGTVDVRDHKVYANAWGHPMASYHPFVDMIGSKALGGKTVLYLIDGLYGLRDVNDLVNEHAHWNQLFRGQWLASLFLSQDPIAIDSVGLDFLRAEFPFGRGNKVQPMINADNYLHEAALADHPPSGTAYAPDGVPLPSLGVHEHWNNPTEKKYSRNLGRAEGIELVTVRGSP